MSKLILPTGVIASKNPWYPLPSDYPQLTIEGQQKARLAVLMDHSTPTKFIEAWSLFRNLYLKNTEPGFFYDDFVPSPKFHYELIEDIATYPYNVVAAPRGFAKSTLISKEIPLLLLLTRPNFKISIGLATDRLLERHFDVLMTQLTTNPNIVEDFGNLKSKKGEGIWNHHTLTLTNGSFIEGFSVTGRKRGARPHLFILDDPEYDPDSDSETARQAIAEKFEVLLFKQIIPMLRRDCSLTWIGTIIGARNYLYYACSTTEDARFTAWNRKIYEAFDPGTDNSIWSGMWSDEALQRRRVEIGESAFASEYLNRPASDKDRILTITPTLNEYSIQYDNEDRFNENPLSDNTSLITYYTRPAMDKDTSPDVFLSPEKSIWEKKTASPASLFRGLFRFLTFDNAEGLSPHHDYSCVMVMGLDKFNCLWILDGWVGRTKRVQRLAKIYEMAVKWYAKVIGIEAVGMQGEISEAMEEYIDNLRQDMPEYFNPRVLPIKYPPHDSKADRISGLSWRYRTGKVKYPAHLKNTMLIRDLYTQTLDFTMDLALLRHDDVIDCVAMSQYVVKSRGAIHPTVSPNMTNTVQGVLAKGQNKICGIPIISGMDASQMTPEILNSLLDNKRTLPYNTKYDAIAETLKPRNNRHPIRRRSR
jgi:hypothetical protein